MIIFLEYRLLTKVMSDEETNFISEKFQVFSRCIDSHHKVSSSNDHQSQ